jgi:hypothetical protein
MFTLKGRPPVSVERREQFWRARHDGGLVVADAAAIGGGGGAHRGSVDPRARWDSSPAAGAAIVSGTFDGGAGSALPRPGRKTVDDRDRTPPPSVAEHSDAGGGAQQ